MIDRMLGSFMQGVSKHMFGMQEASQKLQEASQRQIDSLSQEVKRSAVQILEKILSLAAGSGPPTSSDLPPPPPSQNKHNPWRSYVWLGLSADRTKLLAPSGNLDVQGLEFHPNFDSFPYCYCRFKPSYDGEAIPDVVEQLPIAEATARFSQLCLGSGASNTQTQSFKSKSQFVSPQQRTTFPSWIRPSRLCSPP